MRTAPGYQNPYTNAGKNPFSTAPKPGSWGNQPQQQPQAPYIGLTSNVDGQIQQFSDQRQNLRNLIGQYSNPYSMMNGMMNTGMMGRMGPWEKSPMPDSPIASQYAANIMGGQRQSVMDLAKNLRQSNVRGMRVAGGANPYSQNVKDAYGTLAGGYADRYKQSMDYDRQRVADDNAQRQFLANLGMQGWQNSSSALNNMLNLQYQYAMADEDRRRADLARGDTLTARNRQWGIDDKERDYQSGLRQQQQDMDMRNRQLYNMYAGKGVNQGSQLMNYFMGPGAGGMSPYMQKISGLTG